MGMSRFWFTLRGQTKGFRKKALNEFFLERSGGKIWINRFVNDSRENLNPRDGIPYDDGDPYFDAFSPNGLQHWDMDIIVEMENGTPTKDAIRWILDGLRERGIKILNPLEEGRVDYDGSYVF